MSEDVPDFLAEPPERSDRAIAGLRRRRELRKERYRLALDMLIQHLGGVCARCGSTERPTIDHVDGATWERRALSFMQRVKRYYEEYRAGVPLQVLCHECNSEQGCSFGRGHFRARATA